jgi:hypothetical protein
VSEPGKEYARVCIDEFDCLKTFVAGDIILSYTGSQGFSRRAVAFACRHPPWRGFHLGGKRAPKVSEVRSLYEH